MGPKNEQSTLLTCKFCGRTFTDAGKWWSHDCDEDEAPATVQPAQRDVAAILSNAPRCNIEEDGDCLWA